MANRSKDAATAADIESAARPVLLALAAGDLLGQQQVPDLLASVVEKVFRRTKSQPPVNDVGAYSKQVARTEFSNWLRRKQRFPEQAQPFAGSDEPALDWGNILPDRGMTPASLVVQADDQRRHAVDINEALVDLTAIERSVLYHRFQRGLPANEVAELLGYKSAGVVNVTIGRIRKKLAAVLPGSLVEPFEPRPGRRRARPRARVR